jgi:hypothetical protein
VVLTDVAPIEELPKYLPLFDSTQLVQAATITSDESRKEPGILAREWGFMGFTNTYARLAAARELLVGSCSVPITSFSELIPSEVAAMQRVIDDPAARVQLRAVYARHLADWRAIQNGERTHPWWWKLKLARDKVK